ncbi:DUF3397 domain-containing protein [Alteribacter populi]|uniref:DUF3397 domain-containing protein n=1 Tax=Alteribacter populi TaxID=2011011 RepID=UPI001E65B385|nr:DUF3397 domain-containing protein [Alteribacter populi]
MLGDVMAYVVATLVTAPIIGLYLVYIITVKMTKKKVYALKLAVDWSLLLFMFAVHFIIMEIWNVSLIGMMIALILLTAIVFTFIHWRMYEEIKILRIIKGVWRFQFVVFLVLYFVLMFYGFASEMFMFTFGGTQV